MVQRQFSHKLLQLGLPVILVEHDQHAPNRDAHLTIQPGVSRQCNKNHGYDYATVRL